jgi:colanic acid/amylovoran biosynthesis glycosyltransferase
VEATLPKPNKPSILIYADPLLAPSATFVRSQGEGLQEFVPYYAGARAYHGAGLRLPSERTIVLNEKGTYLGKIMEIPFKVFGCAPFFFRRAQRCSPVLVHAHTGPGALTALPLASYLKVPLVATFHGGDVTADPNRDEAHYTFRTYSKNCRRLQSDGALFIAVSKFVQAKLLAQGYPAQRTVLHYIGVDIAFFQADQQVPREPVVLFVGSLHQGKGCEYAIRAMAKVQSALPQMEFVVLGDGRLRDSLETMAKEKLRRYRFLGTQAPQVVRSWMNRASLFLAPSVTSETGWTEAFGLVFAEAQAMGLPVVSFSSGGIPEAVAHGETGFLAVETDWEALANYILLLLKSNDLWARMSVAGQRRVREYFNLETQTRQLESHYRHVLKEPRLSSR